MRGYALLRSILKSGSDADVAKAVAYGKRIRLYPLSQAANPPATIFVDAIDVVYDATIPYDLRFFQSLDRIVQAEPWLERDRAMIDMLKSIGIEKGKPFNPDAKTQDILERGRARGARLARGPATRRSSRPPFDEGSRWAFPASQPMLTAAQSTAFADPDIYPVDARGVAYSFAFFSAKHLGAGQFYLMTIEDKDGNAFEGGKHLSPRPCRPKAPVRQYWSATVYDRATHALIRDMPTAEPLVADARDCKRTRTVRWTSTSDPRRRPARRRTGFRPAPTAGSRCCSASTAPRRRSSTRPGSCRTSRLSRERRHHRCRRLAVRSRAGSK